MRRFAVNLSIWHSRNLGGARAHLLYVNQEIAEGVTGLRRTMLPWFSQRKSNVGELPEATNKSSCEDIMPPSREDALESNGEGLRWVLPPTGRISSFRRLAPWPFLWLGCWSASCTPSLDTVKSIPHLVKCGLRNCLTVDRRDGYNWNRNMARIGQG